MIKLRAVAVGGGIGATKIGALVVVWVPGQRNGGAVLAEDLWLKFYIWTHGNTRGRRAQSTRSRIAILE